MVVVVTMLLLVLALDGEIRLHFIVNVGISFQGPNATH